MTWMGIRWLAGPLTPVTLLIAYNWLRHKIHNNCIIPFCPAKGRLPSKLYNTPSLPLLLLLLPKTHFHIIIINIIIITIFSHIIHNVLSKRKELKANERERETASGKLRWDGSPQQRNTQSGLRHHFLVRSPPLLLILTAMFYHNISFSL